MLASMASHFRIGRSKLELAVMCRWVHAVVSPVLILASTLLISPAYGDEQSDADKAEQLRGSAAAQAKRQVGYPDVIDVIVGGRPRDVDYYALSLQISRLAAFIRALGSALEDGGQVDPTVAPSPGLLGANNRPAYGPEGPTKKSVRLILEYRLMVTGNPRLTVGNVTEDESRIIAEVATKDGSVVEVYAIVKKTGVWQPVR